MKRASGPRAEPYLPSALINIQRKQTSASEESTTLYDITFQALNEAHAEKKTPLPPPTLLRVGFFSWCSSFIPKNQQENKEQKRNCGRASFYSSFYYLKVFPSADERENLRNYLLTAGKKGRKDSMRRRRWRRRTGGMRRRGLLNADVIAV